MSREIASVTRWEALPDAWKALGHLGTNVRIGFFGDVEGIDSVHLALKALAPALARLFESTDDGPDGHDIEDVVQFLAARNRLGEGAVGALSDVLTGVKNATYQGLTTQGVEELERARENLHGHLDELLTTIEKEAPRA